jgi:hypothetical protein
MVVQQARVVLLLPGVIELGLCDLCPTAQRRARLSPWVILLLAQEDAA